MLLCLKAENRMRFRSRPQMIILALRGGEGKRVDRGRRRRRERSERRKTSVGVLFYKYARGAWVIMSVSGVKLLTLRW